MVEPDSDDQPLWRKLFGPALMVAFLVFVFGWFLPRLIDYRAVLDTLLDLAAGEFLVLVALGTVRLAAEAWIYVALIPGLPLGKSLQAFLASTTVATFMPYPADLVVRFGMYRVWGIDATAAGVGIMTAGFWTIGVKLVLPVLGLIVLIVNGVASDDVVTLAFLAIGVLVAVFVVILAAVRSEGSSAGWAGPPQASGRGSPACSTGPSTKTSPPSPKRSSPSSGHRPSMWSGRGGCRQLPPP